MRRIPEVFSRLGVALIVALPLGACATDDEPVVREKPAPSSSAQATATATVRPVPHVRARRAERLLRRIDFPAVMRPDRRCARPNKECQRLHRARWFRYVFAHGEQGPGGTSQADTAVAGLSRYPTAALARAAMVSIRHDHRARRVDRHNQKGRVRQQNYNVGEWRGLRSWWRFREPGDAGRPAQLRVRVFLRRGPVIIESSVWLWTSSSRRMRDVPEGLATSLARSLSRPQPKS